MREEVEDSMKNGLLAIVFGLGLSITATAQMVEVKDQPAPGGGSQAPAPNTGAPAAQEYFKARQGSANPARERRPSDSGGAPRYLAVHLGTFFSSQAYKWGHGDQDDVGKFNAGVTYRIGEWVDSMDLNFRFDYTSYELDEDPARKLSFSALLTFPDANSRFPLYFGGGIGAGIFMKQLKDESALAFDWTLLAGARFLDVFDNLGFMVEAGMKNHILLLSDGQFNGVFFNVGTVFAF